MKPGAGLPAGGNGEVADSSGAALSVADRVYHRAEAALTVIAAAVILLLMLMGVVQVVERTIFGIAIQGYIDYIEQMTAVFAFLGIAYCQATAGHIRMDLVLGMFKGRLLWALETFGVLLALVVVGLLIESSFQNFLRAYQLGDSTIDIKLPIWPSKLIVPFALTTLWLRLLLQLWGYLRLLRRPDALPIAVPLAKHPDEIAQEEIAAVLHAESGKS